MLTSAIQFVRAALSDRTGVSSIEYGVLAIGILTALAAAMTVFTTDIGTLWTAVETAITNAI